jgi:small subunit ribosomal protein S16
MPRSGSSFSLNLDTESFMAVKIRMKRMGRTNRPEFRIVATDARSPRDGAVLENLGIYHPLEKEAGKVLRLDDERVKYWLSVGAQPSETIMSILKKRGIAIPWVETERKRREKLVAERRAKKGKAPKEKKAAAPKAAAKPGATAATAATENKAEAAASRAAKREAKRAK